MKYRRIDDVDQLKETCFKKWGHYVVRLRSGLVSSKEIRFGGRKFRIIHSVDGTDERMTPDELAADFIIGRAMNGGAFYQEIGD